MKSTFKINLIFLCIAVALFFANPFASKAAHYNTEIFVSATAVYTSYRVINRVLSVAADTSFQVGIFGASAEIKPGQILRSLLDTLDRFADLLFPLMLLAGVLSVSIGPVAALAAVVAAVGFAMRIVSERCAKFSATVASGIERLGNSLAGLGFLFALIIPGTYSLGHFIGNHITAKSWDEAVATFALFEVSVDRSAEAIRIPQFDVLVLPELPDEQNQGGTAIIRQDEVTEESVSEDINRWSFSGLIGQSRSVLGGAWNSATEGVGSISSGLRDFGGASVRAALSIPDYLEKSASLVRAAFDYLMALILKMLVIPILIVGLGLWIWRFLWPILLVGLAIPNDQDIPNTPPLKKTALGSAALPAHAPDRTAGGGE